MRAIQIALAILFAAVMLQAQAPAPMGPAVSPEAAVAAAVANLEQNQTAQGLSQILRTLQTNLKVTDGVKAQVDKLAAEAVSLQNAGNAGEARRRLAHAIALQRGLPWDEKAEFAGSLLLGTNGVVVDSAVTQYGELAQSYPASYKAPNGLRLHLLLASNGTPRNTVRDLGAFDVMPRDLAEDPWKFSARLDGVADGPYKLVAEVTDGNTMIRSLTLTILAVQNLEGQRVAIEQRLAKVAGFDSVKATIRYPFDYARVINIGGRELLARGGPEDIDRFFDFSGEIKKSLSLLKSIESGKDPLLRVKGESQRHYDFTEAGEIMPYHVFVPSKYDGKTALPLVVVLHGAAADEMTYFTQRGPVLVNEAEKHGFIIVTPLGYRPSGGWGRSMAGPAAPPAAPPAGTAAAPAAAAAPGPAAASRSPRQGEFSEKDALNVIELVAKEYGVDRSRMYLMGNSMGGNGTWYIGSKYAEKWAAIAPCGSPSLGESFFPIDKLKGMPILYTQGEQDNAERARTMISWAKEHGLDIPYNEIKNGTHNSAPWDNLPNIFNFFEKQRRK